MSTGTGDQPHRLAPAPTTHVVAPSSRSPRVVAAAVVAVVIALTVSAAAGVGVDDALTHSGSSSNGTGAAGVPSNVDMAAVTARIDPGLVDIDTTLAQRGAAAGTGMVLSASGLVLTNNHVIENATTIRARSVKTGRTYDATVLGYSVPGDVALLQLKGAVGLTPVRTGSSSDLRVGQTVVAIGNAGGRGGTPDAVAGTITALDRTITAGDPGALSETLHGMVETDAAIEPGDSGGSLADTAGRVVAMITAAAVSGSEQGYAIPIAQALVLIAQIEDGQASATVHIGPRALLGVAAVDGVSVAGARVEVVQPGSPADRAGIVAGDTIVSVNGAAISSAQELVDALLDEKPGDTVTIGWVNAAGATHQGVVRLTTGPPA